jgi:hypothetical protein
MENGNSNKRKFKERQKKAKQRANQTPDKIQERRTADVRNKARARANETPEQAHERRAANLRNKAKGRANKTPEQAHERREANLRNVTRHRANQTRAKIQERRNANSRIEEMVSIPRISEFVEVMDSKAKAFHHILKTRIRHDEKLSKEISDFIESHEIIKGDGNSSTIPLYEQCHQANICVCCDRFICGTDELCWIKKILYFSKNQGFSFQI